MGFGVTATAAAALAAAEASCSFYILLGGIRQGEAGSDIAVILAGYSREMFDMLENNPGLRRRFNIDDFGVHFEDMSDADLRQVQALRHAQIGMKSNYTSVQAHASTES